MITEELITEFKDNISNFAIYLERLFEVKGYDEESCQDILKKLYDFAYTDKLDVWLDQRPSSYIEIENFESYYKYLDTLKSYPECKVLSEADFKKVKDIIDFLDNDMYELFILGMSYTKEEYYYDKEANTPLYIREIINKTKKSKTIKE